MYDLNISEAHYLLTILW